jgi:NAD-reducing hydrogenase small subunit
MSVLDMDERLVALAPLFEVVYSPLVDTKKIPEDIDLALIEGAVSNEHDLERAIELRKKSAFVISLGDCAITGNVPSMRNSLPLFDVCRRAYEETAAVGAGLPTLEVPRLLDKVLRVHDVVDVDLFVQGCPPPADAIHFVLSELIAGRRPDATTVSRFGA